MILRRSLYLILSFIIINSCKQSLAQEVSEKASTKMNTPLLKPEFLAKDDSVAIVAPSGILKNRNKEIERADSLLKSWGLKVVIGDNVFRQSGHFAGTDEERAQDFQNYLDNPNIKAIWCARGGYGTVRIIDMLDYTEFKKHPKWVIGYSDITALHNELHNEGIQSIHAMMCTSLTEDLSAIETSIESLKNVIFGSPISYVLEGSNYNKPGTAVGQLVGGNLTMLHTMLGSRTSIDTSGKIMLIEEIGEYKYHIDRMLQSMKRAGYFDNLKGLIVGDMSKLRTNTTLWGTSIEQLILDALEEYDFPIAFNMQAGHENDNRALILGAQIDLTVDSDRSSVNFKNQ